MNKKIISILALLLLINAFNAYSKKLDTSFGTINDQILILDYDFKEAYSTVYTINAVDDWPFDFSWSINEPNQVGLSFFGNINIETLSTFYAKFFQSTNDYSTGADNAASASAAASEHCSSILAHIPVALSLSSLTSEVSDESFHGISNVIVSCSETGQVSIAFNVNYGISIAGMILTNVVVNSVDLIQVTITTQSVTNVYYLAHSDAPKVVKYKTLSRPIKTRSAERSKNKQEESKPNTGNNKSAEREYGVTHYGDENVPRTLLALMFTYCLHNNYQLSDGY